jgi:DNA-directed RNA polymerase specialized sigma24 family protein
VWLTVKEAAEWLDISEAAVRKRIQRCTLAHRRSEGHVYVYRDADETTEEFVGVQVTKLHAKAWPA